MKLILLSILVAAGLLAADATGKWTGTLTPDGEGSGPAVLVLKQDGANLTGTAGPDDSGRHTILNGKAENGKLTFDLEMGSGLAKFTLLQEGEEIKGDVKLERDGETLGATLAVKRAK